MTKSYGEYCALANALDLVGDRWAMLVCRELLDGPKRYSDLRAGLPGVSTDQLATRLRHLQSSGVIAQKRLPRPAPAKVYTLTALGRELEPALVMLARWGLRTIGRRKKAQVFQLGWVGLWLRAAFVPQAAAGPPLSLELRHDTGALHVRVADQQLSVQEGHAEKPDVVVSGDLPLLAQANADPSVWANALGSGAVVISGDPAHIERLQRMFFYSA